MAHSDYETLVQGFVHEKVLVAKLVVPGPKSGNDVEILLCSRQARPINTTLGVDVYPIIERAGGAAIRIEPDKIAGWTGTKEVQCSDPIRFEAFPSADCYVTTGPTFWTTFVIAFPDWHNSRIEIMNGFVDPLMDSITKFEPVHFGLLTDLAFGSDNSVTLMVDDMFDFEKEIEVPQPISDDNLLSADVNNTTDHIFPIIFSDEFVDPEVDWPSTAYEGPVLVVNLGESNEEKVIYKKKDSNGDLVCADNYLSDTEEFRSATAWSNTGISTIEDEVERGPTGELKASRFTGSGAAATIDQTTAHAANGERHAAIWMKEHQDHIGTTAFLRIKDQTGTPISYQTNVVLTERWQRVEVSGDFSAGTGNIIVEFGYASGGPYDFLATRAQEGDSLVTGVYAANGSGAGGQTAGRGAYGTSKQSHLEDDTITEWAEYRGQLDTTEGLNEAWVARDLVNRMLIPHSGYSGDFPTFWDTWDVLAGNPFRRTIPDPRLAKELIAEAEEQGMIIVFGDKDGTVKCLPAFRPAPDPTGLPLLTDSADIVEVSDGVPSLEWNTDKENRVTQFIVHYDRKLDSNDIPYQGTEPEHFEHHAVVGDFAVEGTDRRSRKFKEVFATWLYRRNDARTLGTNWLARFDRGARVMKAKVRFQRSIDFSVGETVLVEADRLTCVNSGSSVAEVQALKWQAIEIDYPPMGEDLDVEFLEAIQARIAHISPAGWPDYDAAPEATKDFYGWVGEAGTNLVGTVVQVAGYVIS